MKRQGFFGKCNQISLVSNSLFAILQLCMTIALLATLNELSKVGRIRRNSGNDTAPDVFVLSHEKTRFQNLLRTLETEVVSMSTLRAHISSNGNERSKAAEARKLKEHEKSNDFASTGGEGWRYPAIYLGNEANMDFIQRWTSQEGQDKAVAQILNNKRNGYFIDLAANDAVRLSNTLTLEQQFGWNGLCIEPNLQYMRNLLRRRCKLVVAAVGPQNNHPVNFAVNGVYSGIISEGLELEKSVRHKFFPHVEMKTVTVEKIFSDFNVPPVIDYLSLDIEGAEMWAFETFPWAKYKFLTLTVERPGKLAKVLSENGYHYLRDYGTFGDQFWIHKSLPNFQEVVDKFAASNDTQT